MTTIVYPFQGLPPASSLVQSILLAQLAVLRRTDSVRLDGADQLRKCNGE